MKIMNNSAQAFRIVKIQPIECFRQGFELIKADYWLLFALSLLGWLIGGITFYIALGAMLCGVYFCFLKKIDGQAVSLDDLWVGFQHFKPALIVTAFLLIPMLSVYLGLYGQILAMAFFGQNISPERLTSIIFGSLLFDVSLSILLVCFHTLILFSYLLIVDRGLSGFQAMLTSAKAVWGNLSGIAGIFGVAFLLSLVGLAGCGFGIYFVLPIIFAGYTAAYRKIFPSLTENFNPPKSNSAFSK